MNADTNGSDGRRLALSSLSGQSFDVAIIGGGVNGGSAAHHLSAEGYKVLLVEKSDFGAGASSRSSRLLHCGLAGLAPSSSIWEFALHPMKFKAALRSAREMALCRQEFVTTMPEHVQHFTFCYPIYDDGPFSGWQLDLAFKLLQKAGGDGVPLDYRRVRPAKSSETPLLDILQSPERVTSVATFREYNFDWAERVVVDTVLAAEKLGATIRNHTALQSYARKGDQWELVLSDALDGAATSVAVTARSVLNMTGPWVDEVHQRTDMARPPRLIKGKKGVHIMVRLPPEFRGRGLYNDRGTFLYMMPFRDMHYIGPGDMPFEGNLDNVCATEADIEFVLANAASILPGLGLKRADVLYAWAGVQPKTYDTSNPEGTWSREFHDLSASGMPNFLALTGATIGRSRMSGRDTVAKIRAQLKPSGRRQTLSYAAIRRPHDPNSPPLLNHDTSVRLADIRHAVEHEHAETLADIMFRRTGAGWGGTMAHEGAQIAAQILGESRGWTPERIDREVASYLDEIARRHGVNAG